MPKLKTHSGSKKRFNLTKSGKVKVAKAFKSHILTKKPTKRTRSPTWIKSRKWKAAACRSSFPPRRESNFERHYKYEKEKLLCPS